MHLRAPGLHPLSRRQSISAHRRDKQTQPARSRLGLRSIRLARRRRALRRGSSEALPAAPLHRRSRSRPEPSRLRLLRNEDVPRALATRAAPTSAMRKKPRAVESFLATRGESKLVTLRSRTRSSFGESRIRNAPPHLHAQVQKVEAGPRAGARTGAADEPAARRHSAGIRKPRRSRRLSLRTWPAARPRGFSTLGMRIQNERSGSSSLFAQPMAIEPVPEEARSDQGSADRTNSPAATMRPQSQSQRSINPPKTAARGMLESAHGRPFSPALTQPVGNSAPRTAVPARGISLCSSAGTTAPKRVASAKSSFPTTKAIGLSKRFCAAAGRIAAAAYRKCHE